MKKHFICKYIAAAAALAALCCFFTLAACSAQESDAQYLRIHIRANSNEDKDQAVKYAVKDAAVAFLSPQLENAATLQDALLTAEKNVPALTELCSEVLAENGFDYGARVRVCREEFPARAYLDLTLPDGVYDALIIELGEGAGDNWWCVMFPPLCFVSAPNGDFAYKSLLAELWRKYFS